MSARSPGWRHQQSPAAVITAALGRPSSKASPRSSTRLCMAQGRATLLILLIHLQHCQVYAAVVAARGINAHVTLPHHTCSSKKASSVRPSRSVWLLEAKRPARRTTARMHIAEGLSAGLFRDGLSAFVASAAATVLLHPLDTVKTRLQRGGYSLPTPFSAAPASSLPLGESTALESPGGSASLFENLYCGLASSVLKEAPDTAVYLALCEMLSRTLLAEPSSWWSAHLLCTWMFAGAVGDAAGSVLRVPAEIVCKRSQTGSSGLLDVFADTSRETWLACWAAVLSRDVPMGGLQVAFYAQVHAALPEALSQMSQVLPDSLTDIISGGIAGAIAAALTTPLDVLVTHTMTDSKASDRSEGAALGTDPVTKGPIELLRQGGSSTLTKGIGLRVLYYAPSIAIFFTIYEGMRRFLDSAV